MEADAQSGKPTDNLTPDAHRQLIGYIGLVVPALLILIALERDGRALFEALESISAYYYTGAVAVFTGMLVALSLALFTYRGYDNEYHWADKTCGIVAAVAALGVAYFPTAAPIDALKLSWWAPWMGIVHHVCAVVTFPQFCAVRALAISKKGRGEV